MAAQIDSDPFAELRVAAARVADAAGSCHREASPAVLTELEAALRDLTSSSYSLGHMLVPRPRVGESVWHYYSRGEADGELTRSHEHQAQALAALHELGASTSGAARRCRATFEVLAPPEARGDEQRDAARARAATSG
jgi:hypothetical protein